MIFQKTDDWFLQKTDDWFFVKPNDCVLRKNK